MELIIFIFMVAWFIDLKMSDRRVRKERERAWEELRKSIDALQKALDNPPKTSVPHI